MYAITGITGRVGGELSRTLLAAGQVVRAIVRDARKGEGWAARGCELALADLEDSSALTVAFDGATAVFILPPPVFDPKPGYPEAQSAIKSIVKALRAALPTKVVCLSTIGAHADRDNLLSQHTMMEAALRELRLPVTILRPAWFMDNAAWDVESARQTGLIHSFLQPLDKAFPMVAAKEVGRVAADLIRQDWTGRRVVELEGPRRVSPHDLASAFARVILKPVQAVPVPRGTWEELFRSQGMRNPEPRMRMLDGFNEGWIDFEGGETCSLKGKVALESVLRELVARVQ